MRPRALPHRPARPATRRVAGAATTGVAAAVVLAGCSSAVPVPVATHATDPRCAQVVLAVPATLAELDQRRTTSQATTAWGADDAPITLRCGVEPLGPTTDRCVQVETPNGPTVDWVVTAGDDGDWTFTTYGREPAVQVHVPEAVATTRSTSFLDDLGPAVVHADQVRSCL